MVSLLALPRPPSPRFPDANGKIAFTSSRDGNVEIYTMNADGTGQTSLTNNAASDARRPPGRRTAPRSPSTQPGRQLRDLHDERRRHGPDQAHQQRGVRRRQPAWSPDGTKIAFTSNRDGNYEIYTMNADGTGQTSLTNNAAYDFDPAWSPDGTKIAFTSDRDGNLRDLHDERRRHAARPGSPTTRRSTIRPPGRPDGTKIAFRATRRQLRDLHDERRRHGPDQPHQQRGVDDAPAWSPDGTKIAFTSRRDGNDEIYTMNADGTGQTNITNNAAATASPTGRLLLRQLSIDDVSHAEGNSGTTTYTFTVTRTGSANAVSTVHYATADATATDADNDYKPASGGCCEFAIGETTKAIAVTVATPIQSSRRPRSSSVNLSSPTNATIADNQGKGTIRKRRCPAHDLDQRRDRWTRAMRASTAFASPSRSRARAPRRSRSHADQNGSATAGSNYTALGRRRSRSHRARRQAGDA